MPVTALKTVVLPAPLGPMSDTIWCSSSGAVHPVDGRQAAKTHGQFFQVEQSHCEVVRGRVRSFIKD